MDANESSAAFGADIVRRIREGEPTAESELVSRYRPRVTQLIRRTSRDTSSVDDVHQQTFHIALQKIRRGDVREPEKLSRFIKSLTRNLVIEHYRETASQPSQGLDEANAAPVDPSPGPLESLLAVEEASIARRVLAELPSERDREILYRFYIAEDEKDAICRDLGLTSLHFNRVLHRARERYRELYEEMRSWSGATARDDEADHDRAAEPETTPSWLR